MLHPKFINQKINYIHYNPVEAGIVDQPEDYKYSSARNYMERDDAILEVEVLDYDVRDSYIFM